jgi:hypothetical protein
MTVKPCPVTTWRLRTTLIVPTLVLAPPEGGLPKTLQFQSRVLDQVREYGAYRVKLRNADDSPEAALYSQNPQIALVDLLTDVEAENDDARSATRAFGSTLEAIVDLMTFEMGSPVGIGTTDLIDVTPPVSVGQERAVNIFASGPFDINARQVEMQAIQGLAFGRLPDISAVQDSRIAAALRWFTKSLSTVLLHDQFLFLWIALEILSDDSDVKVEAPYRANCGHEIPSCPTCNSSTAKPVFGPSRKAFLESFSVSPEDSRALWSMRQMMHGAISFDSKKLDKLPSLLQVLRAVVAEGVKDYLGIKPEAPPLISPDGMAIHPSLSLGGTRVITEKDIEPL